VPEGVDDATEPPAVLVLHGRGFRRAGDHCLADNRVGIFDHQERPAGGAVDRTRLSRFIVDEVGATQNAASPTPS
jgi:hypothetical protein